MKRIFNSLVLILLTLSISAQTDNTTSQPLSVSTSFEYVFFFGGKGSAWRTLLITPSSQGIKLSDSIGNQNNSLTINRAPEQEIISDLSLDEVLFYLINSSDTEIIKLFVQTNVFPIEDKSVLFPNATVRFSASFPEYLYLYEKFLCVIKINKSKERAEWSFNLGFNGEETKNFLTLISFGYHNPLAQRDPLTPPAYFNFQTDEQEVFRSTNQTRQFTLVYNRLYELATRLQGRSME